MACKRPCVSTLIGVILSFYLGCYLSPLLDLDITRPLSMEATYYRPYLYMSNYSTEDLQFPNPSTCLPQQQVFYLKTFKTGSTTLAVMFYRYAWRHNLTVLPVLRDPFPAYIDPQYIADPNDGSNISGPYDILTEHIRYNEKAVEDHTKKNTMYILSLRHPFSQLKSYFNEYKLLDKFQIYPLDPVLVFLKHIAKNPMHYHSLRELPSINSYQLGLEPKDKYNVTAIESLVRYVENTFDVVLLTEYFDESLVILRRKFCWTHQDILYLATRQRDYQPRTYDLHLTRAFEKWSFADYVLYNHFLKRHFKFMTLLSQDFFEEVVQFKSSLKVAKSFCHEIMNHIKKDPKVIYKLAGDLITGAGRREVKMEASLWNTKFSLHAVECALMSLTSRVLRNIVRLQQMPQLCSQKTNIKHLSIYEGAYMASPTVAYIHPSYCRSYSSYYKLYIGVLAERDAYMFAVVPDLKHL